jgi:hypothetical protein
MGTVSCKGIYNIYFPVLKRFRYVAIIFAVALATMYIFCSFGFILLTNYFGYNGVYSIFVVIIGFFWGLDYYQKLEKENKNINYLTDLMIFNKKIL